MPLRRMPTGVHGFDELTGGGLPAGRVTLVLGGPGTGKTTFALETLAHGARDQDEAGVFVAFEESAEQVVENAEGFDWNPLPLVGTGLHLIEARLPESALIGGAFDVQGLLAVIGVKVRETGASRVVFDAVDVLLGMLEDPAAIRREVVRIRDWLAEHGLTGILTAKSGPDHVWPEPQYHFLQYLADCVVTLDHRLSDRTAIRGLRVVKFRGGSHSTNEFTFAITRLGIDVASGASPEMVHPVFDERVETGVERLDRMLTGGYYRGSSVLITGAPGTAKTTLSGAFAVAACQRGEPTLFVSFDEAADQVVRNLASVGLSLRGHVENRLLVMRSLRARSAAPKEHVARIARLVDEHRVRNLIVDPLSAMVHAGGASEAEDAAVHLLDVCKRRGITLVSTTVLPDSVSPTDATPISLSTLADTWMHLSYVNQGGERNRALTIVKSRGMEHSNQVRELILSSSGIALADVYSAGGEVLMGTLRWEKEQQVDAAAREASREAEDRRRERELALAESEARLRAVEREAEVRRRDLERSVLEHERLQAEVERRQVGIRGLREAEGRREREEA